MSALTDLVNGMKDTGWEHGQLVARGLLNHGVVLITRDEEGQPSLSITGEGTPPAGAFGPPSLTEAEAWAFAGEPERTPDTIKMVSEMRDAYNAAAADGYWTLLEHTTE